MKRVLVLYAAMALLSAVSIHAQSLDYIKSLIIQEQYREAAQQLRPMAERGNSEAQFLAAQLFFAGKGVVKSDTQGEKYATSAANQGNEKALVLLADHYYQKNNRQKMFSTLSTAVSKHPLQQGKVSTVASSMHRTKFSLILIMMPLSSCWVTTSSWRTYRATDGERSICSCC